MIDGGPDFSVVSKAWWDAVDLIEKSSKDKIFACDMTLDCRIMGGSDVTMSPQFGNKHGTCSIEVLSTSMVPEFIWEEFKEEIAKIWRSYKDCDGTPLNARFHWAKEMPQSVNINGVQEDHKRYWDVAYGDRMKEFFDVLESLTDGVSVQDLNRLFSNKYLDRIYQSQWERFGVNVSNSGFDQIDTDTKTNGSKDSKEDSPSQNQGSNFESIFKCCQLL